MKQITAIIKPFKLEEVREALAEAETDKALLEVPSPAEGVVLRLDFEAGQAVPYKSVIAWIGQKGEAITNDEGTVSSGV